jgi:hypothetical protein
MSRVSKAFTSMGFYMYFEFEHCSIVHKSSGKVFYSQLIPGVVFL